VDPSYSFYARTRPHLFLWRSRSSPGRARSTISSHTLSPLHWREQEFSKTVVAGKRLRGSTASTVTPQTRRIKFPRINSHFLLAPSGAIVRGCFSGRLPQPRRECHMRSISVCQQGWARTRSSPKAGSGEFPPSDRFSFRYFCDMFQCAETPHPFPFIRKTNGDEKRVD